MVLQEVVLSAFWVVHGLTRMHGLTRIHDTLIGTFLQPAHVACGTHTQQGITNTSGRIWCVGRHITADILSSSVCMTSSAPPRTSDSRRASSGSFCSVPSGLSFETTLLWSRSFFFLFSMICVSVSRQAFLLQHVESFLKVKKLSRTRTEF